MGTSEVSSSSGFEFIWEWSTISFRSRTKAMDAILNHWQLSSLKNWHHLSFSSVRLNLAHNWPSSRPSPGMEWVNPSGCCFCWYRDGWAQHTPVLVPNKWKDGRRAGFGVTLSIRPSREREREREQISSANKSGADCCNPEWRWRSQHKQELSKKSPPFKACLSWSSKWKESWGYQKIAAFLVLTAKTSHVKK